VIRLAEEKKKYMPLVIFVPTTLELRDNKAIATTTNPGNDPIVIYFVIAETLKKTILDPLFSNFKCIGREDLRRQRNNNN